MNTAEKIYSHVRALPEPVAQEISDFVQFLEGKAARERAGIFHTEGDGWPDIVLSFEGVPYAPPLEQDRLHLTPHSEDPLS